MAMMIMMTMMGEMRCFCSSSSRREGGGDDDKVFQGLLLSLLCFSSALPKGITFEICRQSTSICLMNRLVALPFFW